MKQKDYEMSEQAFLDVWNKYGSPGEITNIDIAYKFLNDLFKATEGWVIVDHFSYTNYDHISAIRNEKDYLFIYWKDFVKNPVDDFTFEIFGNSHYKYSLIKFRKMKFLHLNNHLYILFMPNISKLKEIKELLDVSTLEIGSQILINEDMENLNTELRFIKDNKIHDCVLHNLPFYSFIIHPKQNSGSVAISKAIMLIETINYNAKRLEKVNNKFNNITDDDHDDISALGNIMRQILESVLKYYCIYREYLLPKDNYGDNMLGALKRHLTHKNDDVVLELITSRVITLCNEFSHDTGTVYTVNDAKELHGYINHIINKIYSYMEKNDFR
jgi:hypothetical protein